MLQMTRKMCLQTQQYRRGVDMTSINVINGAFIHPASRSDAFKSKSFTENIITNVIKVCCPKKSFVIDDNKMKSIFFNKNYNDSNYLCMVINGYYVEVPVSEALGAKGFYIWTEDLGFE